MERRRLPESSPHNSAVALVWLLGLWPAMLYRTFLHLPGVGLTTEGKLWRAGVANWQQALDQAHLLPPTRRGLICGGLEESQARLEAGDADWFASRLPPAETWRLASHFGGSMACVDIETTGIGQEDHITAIALWDGQRLRSYVHGRNLEEFADDIRQYALLVTFNGRCFDAPVLERSLAIQLPKAHLDLRCILKSLGLRGGLKAVERGLGFDRGPLHGVDGYFAVLLWHEYVTYGDEAVLETLLAYNAADVLLLPQLLAHAFNAKVAAIPFADLAMPLPQAAVNPHRVHVDVLERVRRRYGLG